VPRSSYGLGLDLSSSSCLPYREDVEEAAGDLERWRDEEPLSSYLGEDLSYLEDEDPLSSYLEEDLLSSCLDEDLLSSCLEEDLLSSYLDVDPLSSDPLLYPLWLDLDGLLDLDLLSLLPPSFS